MINQMHESVLDEETKKNIKILSLQAFIKSFYLAGGTGCALHLGHRISNDLDFFSKKDFSHFEIQQSLRSSGHFLTDYSDSHTLIGRFNKTKISFFHYNYPLIRDTLLFLDLRISSLEDIGCMKVDAISSRGSRRDFVDLFFILKKFNIGLNEFFKYFEEKYGKENFNIYHVLKSLVYFEEAEKDPELNMLVQFSWENVKSYFSEQIKRFKL
jgi:hypothetical protein